MIEHIDFLEIKQKLIKKGVPAGDIKLGEPLSQYTSFKVGGPADLFIEPGSVEELKLALTLLREMGISTFILGKGTNLLVSDLGIRGAVIRVGEKIAEISIEGESVIAEAGCLLSILSKTVAREGLTGIEFASGIPGTLGGGLAMNAGAYDGELSCFVEWVEVLDENLEIRRLCRDEMDFAYRHSCLEEKGYIALKCGMKLQPGEKDEIDGKMNDFAERRRTKQPLTLPSAGSTFKRPAGSFAGKLIEEAGLRGYRHGGASVSELHCGFVVTDGESSATEIYELIQFIKAKVQEHSGVLLEPEVKMVGEFACSLE